MILFQIFRFTYLVLISGIIVCAAFSAENAFFEDRSDVEYYQTIQFNHPDISNTDSLHLTDQKVKDWIRTRIAVARLQIKMKANAAEYDAVVEEFYSKRETLLESRGWSVKEFETAKERIHAAITAMDIEDELEATREDHEEEIAEIESNEYFSEEQKEEVINGLESVREQKRELYIDPVKSYLSAIRPHRSTLQHMMSWIAGNTAHPPELK